MIQVSPEAASEFRKDQCVYGINQERKGLLMDLLIINLLIVPMLSPYNQQTPVTQSDWVINEKVAGLQIPSSAISSWVEEEMV